MAGPRLGSARREFQERLLTQLRARYSDWGFQAAAEGFGVIAAKERCQVSLSLDSLFAEVNRPEVSVPEQISRFVTGVGPRLSGAEAHPERAQAAPDPGGLVWCVRTERSIRRYRRYAELATRELPGGLLAFVAETLPGEAMRGVSRAEAEAGGLSASELAQHADYNTCLRLTRWGSVLDQNPKDRTWLFTDDALFSSSLLLVPAFLARLGQLGGGRAAIAAPDRAMVVAAVGEAAEPKPMLELARRLYRLASFPLSPVLLTTDGLGLELHPAEGRPTAQSGWRRLFGAGDS
ncbi:MAG TPA: hypothetical protein VI138_07455 [Candidatus Dormibacteraeota bacterium]